MGNHNQSASTKVVICLCGRSYRMPQHQSTVGMTCRHCGESLAEVEAPEDADSEFPLLRWLVAGCVLIIAVALFVVVVLPQLNSSDGDAPPTDPDGITAAAEQLFKNPIPVNPGRDSTRDSTSNGQSKDTGSAGKNSPRGPQTPRVKAPSPPNHSPTNGNKTKSPTPTETEKLPPSLWTYSNANSFAVSQDGTRALTYANDNPLRRTNVNIELTLWDFKTGELLQELESPGIASSIAFSPDGRYVACTSRGTPGPVTFNVWNVETGKLAIQSEVPIPGNGIAFAEDSSEVWAYIPRTGLRRFGMASKQSTLNDQLPQTIFEAKYALAKRMVVFKHNSSRGQWLDVYSMPDLRKIRTIRVGVIGSYNVSADGKTIAIGQARSIKLYDPMTGTRLKAMARSGERLAPVTLQFSKDGKFLAELPFGVGGQRPAIWNLETGNRKEINVDKINAIALCDRGLAVLNDNHSVGLFDLVTGEAIQMPLAEQVEQVEQLNSATQIP